MKRSICAASIAVAVCLLGAALAAQDRSRVTITGCVHEGTAPDTFVLTNVTEGPLRATDGLAAANAPAVIYWLSSTKGLKEHIGHQIQVTGPTSMESVEGKVKVQTDTSSTPESKIAVESAGKKVEANNALPVPVGTSGTKATDEVKKPVYRLKVESLRMIAPTCL